MALELCGICHQPREYHEKDTVRHQFDVGGKLMAKVTSPPPTSSRGVPSGDPILRLLLIRKGIISADDIDAAEKELRALGVAGVGPVARSSREDTRVDI
ncbi:MAG: hypothetical protein DMF62_04870 [Acidobacteria bacterium]|nr:MAG: hypothetical protein DMF62_04870 [Acidobacteriota bacterium]